MSEFTMSMPPDPYAPSEPQYSVQFASFWKRLLAYLIDGIVLGIPASILYVIAIFSFIPTADWGNAHWRHEWMDKGDMTALNQGGLFPFVSIIVCWLLYMLLVFLYFSVMESSKTGGTLGKRAMGLRVTDMQGNRISWPRAAGRTLGRALCSMTMGIGYLVILFTERHQGLHDMVAATMVLDMGSQAKNVSPNIAENVSRW